MRAKDKKNNLYIESDANALIGELRGRVSQFGWFEELAGGSVRFVMDHAGSVPLYYAREGGRVLAGSTPRAVAQQMASPKLDAVSVADFLLNGIVCYPYTIFEGVYAAPPGAVTDVSPHHIHSTQFYRPEETASSAKVESWGRRLREGVQRSLLAGIEGRDKVKVLFSAGEDSRALVSLIPREVDCELITFADSYNREVRIAEGAAKILRRPWRFVRRPPGFYTLNLRERSQDLGGAFDIRHTHVWGELAAPLHDAGALVGGLGADVLFKSNYVPNIKRSRRRLGPEKLSPYSHGLPLWVEIAEKTSWINSELAAAVDERHRIHHERILEFRPTTARNWHRLWPRGTQGVAHAHYLAARLFCDNVVEPFFSPQVYSLAAEMPDTFRVDRKAFRAAFGPTMGRVAWMPTSSGRVPRLSGYIGHWTELLVVASRRAVELLNGRFQGTAGNGATGQGAWSPEHRSFQQDLGEALDPVQLETLRDITVPIFGERGWNDLCNPSGSMLPNLVRNRAVQVGYVADL